MLTCYNWLYNLEKAIQYFAKFFLETIVKIIVLSLTNFQKKMALKGLPYP